MKKPIKAGIVLQMFFLIVCMYANIGCHQKRKPSRAQRMVVEADVSKYFYRKLQGLYELKSEMELYYMPFKHLDSVFGLQGMKSFAENGKVKWEIYSRYPIQLNPPFGASVIMNPGDSLHIKYIYDYPVYSGTNAPADELLTSLMRAEEGLVKPATKYSYNARSLADFMEWNQYLDHKVAVQLPILESYKHKIQPPHYKFYMAAIACAAEGDRLDAFSALHDSVKVDYPGLSVSDLCSIWDSTQNKSMRQWLRSQSEFYGSISKIYAYNRMETGRQFNFDFHNDSLNAKETRTYLYYTTAKRRYTGGLREKLMVFILDEQTITEMGTDNKMTQTILKDYYQQPGFPEYKQHVRQLEIRARKINHKS